MSEPSPLRSERLKVRESPEAIARLFEARGWGDGLPVVPPTPERVARMVEASGLAPGEEIGLMPPRQGVATAEAIAVNAVMAGCHPSYMPVVIAAVRAVLDPAFGLFAIQATTHPVAPLVIVNGPAAERLGVNGAYGCFGPGQRANATIGRALRLVLLNIGGGAPGRLDRSTQGAPAKYTFCIAENERESPWEPLHVERGLGPEESAVTAIGVEGPHNVNDHVSEGPEGLLSTIADTMAVMGSNNFYLRGGETVLCLGPEHAAALARGGLSKADVKCELHTRARKRIRELRRGGMWGMFWPDALEAHAGDDDHLVPLLDRPEDLIVIVAGGAGKHSSYMPSFGNNRSATVKVTFPD